jgi:plasmid stabilization system protein ParE
VATVAYSAGALGHLERDLRGLHDGNPAAAAEAVTAIRSGIGLLASHPLIGRRIEGDIRELVISYGKTGYVALYHFVVPRDEVRLLAIRHQRALGFVP